MSSSDHLHGITQELALNVDSWAPPQGATFLTNSPDDPQVREV